MCGIAGKIYLGNKIVQHTDLKLMGDKIAHRGPNDKGYFISRNKKVGIVNKRLSIIDLSKKGQQPMSYMGRYRITTNGEIYNFLEEKKKLEKVGDKFNSNCDTEVILALYDKYKEKCLTHLRGMFAFCIYDSVENTVFLARDRIGVKPLKYFIGSNTLIFSSEVKAILTQKEVAKSLDYKAIQMYLIYGYIPSPYTGFLNIAKLEPGSYLFIDLKSKKVVKKRYWTPGFSEKLQLSEKEWCQKILDTLEESTKLRLTSVVPLGALLSGGVDSSGVVAAMAKLSNRPVNTFTITFKDNKWNEAIYANLIAKKYKTNHTELEVNSDNFELLPDITYSFEEPFGDAGCLLSYIVYKLAKKYVTVILNGDGGDENFAGYPNRYFRLKRDVDFRSWITHIRPAASLILKPLHNISSNGLIDRCSNFFEKSKFPIYQNFISYNQIFTLKEIEILTKGKLANKDHLNDVHGPVKNIFELFKGKDLKDAGLKFDLMYWLPDDLLAKSDLMSMANSLEARSPFLDHKMIELSGKIPFNLKVKKGESKYILKKALEKIVPKENLYREKMGFGIPLSDWFSGKLNSYSKKILLNRRS